MQQYKSEFKAHVHAFLFYATNLYISGSLNNLTTKRSDDLCPQWPTTSVHQDFTHLAYLFLQQLRYYFHFAITSSIFTHDSIYDINLVSMEKTSN
jgi:hypothetical protein